MITGQRQSFNNIIGGSSHIYRGYRYHFESRVNVHILIGHRAINSFVSCSLVAWVGRDSIPLYSATEVSISV